MPMQAWCARPVGSRASRVQQRVQKGSPACPCLYCGRRVMAQDGRPDATKGCEPKGVQGAPAAEHIRMAPFLFEKSLLIPPSASNHVRCASGASVCRLPGTWHR